MFVKKLGVNALLSMLRFSKSFQSDNHVYCDLNNSTWTGLFANIKRLGGDGPLLNWLFHLR